MSGRKRQKKYKGCQVKTYDFQGTTYSSDFEIAVKKSLDRILKRYKRNKNLKFEFEYETDSFDYILKKNYTPDWPVDRPDGTRFYIESKGLFDREARAKMLAVKEQHPDKEFVLLFQRDNPIYKGSNTKYSDWAKKHGFDFSVGCIPLRWLLGSLCPIDKKEEVFYIE